MTERDPLDALGDDLFAAARQEQPSRTAREQALQRAADADAGGGLDVNAGRSRSAYGARHAVVTRYAVVIGATLALAAVAWIVLAPRLRPAREPQFAVAPEAFERIAEHTPQRVDGLADAVEDDRASTPASGKAEARRAGLSHAATHKAEPSRTRSAPANVSLADEVAALDRVRTALASSDIARALVLLDDYDHVLHGTTLRAEAAVLRIEALAAGGQRAKAAKLAQRFISDYPGSPLADRARALSQTASDIEGGSR